jgi:hypothetical protein
MARSMGRTHGKIVSIVFRVLSPTVDAEESPVAPQVSRLRLRTAAKRATLHESDALRSLTIETLCISRFFIS